MKRILAAIAIAAVVVGCELAPFQTPDGYTCEGSAQGTCASIAQYEEETMGTVAIYFCWGTPDDPPECDE